MSNTPDKVTKTLIFIDTLPHIGTLFGLWVVRDFLLVGENYVQGECACFSLLGRKLTLIGKERFDCKSRGDLPTASINEYCKRHVKQTLADHVSNHFNGIYIPPLPYIESDDPDTFLNLLAKAGIGSSEFNEVRDKSLLLSDIIPYCGTRVDWPSTKQ